MKLLSRLCLLSCIGMMPLQALPQTTGSAAHETESTVEGLVRDIACPIQNPEATATHFSMNCLLACARKGSPIIVLAKDGEIYLPISSEMPDRTQRQNLVPYLGKYVRVTGTVFERKGTRAITIKNIQELKDVKLNIEGR